jgi:tRNA-modifying protein YgfZ
MTQGSETGRACFLDLSTRAKLRITGTDRFRFLNGQITNDLRNASETAAVEACVLNAKGKLDAHIFIAVVGESFLIDAEPDLRETLRARLERYVIADDVQIEDVTDEFSLFHVLAEASPQPEHGRIFSVQRFATPGYDISSDPARHDAVRDELASGFLFVDSAAAEVMRIEQGLPRWGRELTDNIIPIEANLEGRTIDYEKGCYIGQEVVARVKYIGHVNRRFVGIVAEGQDLPEIRSAVRKDGKDVGYVTTSLFSPGLGKPIAMGFVNRVAAAPGVAVHLVGQETMIPATVVDLPFIPPINR